MKSLVIKHIMSDDDRRMKFWEPKDRKADLDNVHNTTLVTTLL
jgi:hypothetical protein